MRRNRVIGIGSEFLDGLGLIAHQNGYNITVKITLNKIKRVAESNGREFTMYRMRDHRSGELIVYDFYDINIKDNVLHYDSINSYSEFDANIKILLRRLWEISESKQSK